MNTFKKASAVATHPALSITPVTDALVSRQTLRRLTQATVGLAILTLASTGCSPLRQSSTASQSKGSSSAAPSSAEEGSAAGDPAVDVGVYTPMQDSSGSGSSGSGSSGSGSSGSGSSGSGSSGSGVSGFRFDHGFCVDAAGNPGRNFLPPEVRDIPGSSEVSELLRRFGGECLSLRAGSPADPIAKISGGIEHRSLRGVLAAGRIFENFRLFQSTSVRGNFEHSNWKLAELHQSDLNEAVFREAQLLKVAFYQSSLKGSDWRKADIHKGVFVLSDLEGAQFQQSHLRSIHFTDSNLRGAHFEGADLQDQVSFEGSALEGATFNCRTKLPFPHAVAFGRGMVETACLIVINPLPIPSFLPVPAPTLTPIPFPIPTRVPTIPPIPRPIPTNLPTQGPIPPIPLPDPVARPIVPTVIVPNVPPVVGPQLKPGL